MAYLNKVIICGNIGQDPELKTTPNGQTVVTVNVATKDRYRTKTGEQKTQWHRVVVWGKRAEVLAKFTKKGSAIMFEGTLQYRSFKGQDGQTRYITEIMAEDMHFMTSGKSSQTTETTEVNESALTDEPLFTEDSVPF